MIDLANPREEHQMLREMMRDFTYIDDIVEGVLRATKHIPRQNESWSGKNPDQTCAGQASVAETTRAWAQRYTASGSGAFSLTTLAGVGFSRGYLSFILS